MKEERRWQDTHSRRENEFPLAFLELLSAILHSMTNLGRQYCKLCLSQQMRSLFSNIKFPTENWDTLLRNSFLNIFTSSQSCQRDATQVTPWFSGYCNFNEEINLHGSQKSFCWEILENYLRFWELDTRLLAKKRNTSRSRFVSYFCNSLWYFVQGSPIFWRHCLQWCLLWYFPANHAWSPILWENKSQCRSCLVVNVLLWGKLWAAGTEIKRAKILILEILKNRCPCRIRKLGCKKYADHVFFCMLSKLWEFVNHNALTKDFNLHVWGSQKAGKQRKTSSSSVVYEQEARDRYLSNERTSLNSWSTYWKGMWSRSQVSFTILGNNVMVLPKACEQIFLDLGSLQYTTKLSSFVAWAENWRYAWRENEPVICQWSRKREPLLWLN